MTLHRIVLEGVWDGPDELVWIGWCCPGERARCSPPERPVETPLPGSAERYSVTKRDQIRQTADYPDSPVESCVSRFFFSQTALINVVRPLWPVYSCIGEFQVNQPSSKRKSTGLSWGEHNRSIFSWQLRLKGYRPRSPAEQSKGLRPN